MWSYLWSYLGCHDDDVTAALCRQQNPDLPTSLSVCKEFLSACSWWFLSSPSQYIREKGRDLTQSYGKSPSTDKKSKEHRDKTKTPPKTLITQRLRTDLERSVGVTIALQLVRSNRLTGSQPSHSPQQLCNRWHEHAGIILQ